jgi:hypothetical protein
MDEDAKAVLRGHSGLRAATIQLDQHGRPLKLEGGGGRPPTDPLQVQALQDELKDYLGTESAKGRKPKQDPECLNEVMTRIEARGWQIGRSIALRQIVKPVHRAVWPE